jgi:hypothetical protein
MHTHTCDQLNDAGCMRVRLIQPKPHSKKPSNSAAADENVADEAASQEQAHAQAAFLSLAPAHGTNE